MALALLKLQNGTELIGDVVECNEQLMQVRDPLQINYKFLSFQPMPAISVSRYMPFAQDTLFEFGLDNIMHAVIPKQAVMDYYYYALKNYQENIDPMVEMELSSASDRPIKPKSSSVEDFYKTLLERAENEGGPLN